MTEELKLSAPIEEVTVFQGKALVTRKGKVEVKEGEHVIVLKGLPLAVTPDSLRVSGEGLEGSMITGVDIMRSYETEALDDERRRLEKEYKEALERQDKVQEELDELSRQLSQLDVVASNFQDVFPRALAYHKANIDDHRSFNEYVNTKRKELTDAIRTKRKELERVQKETTKARNYLDLASSKSALETNKVEVGVAAKKAGPMDLTVSYVVSGADWEPVYDVRVITDEANVNISYYGIVKQTTGEDWDNVGLVLSTAPHTEARELPELSPWYLTTYVPSPPRKSRGMGKMDKKMSKSMLPMSAPAEMAAGGMAFDMEGEEEILDEMQIATADVEESGEAIVFRVRGKDTVPSDGQPKKLAVAIIDLNCKTEYLAIPKLTPEAYLKAKIKNETEYVFLGGKVNLFQEDDYIGATYISTVAPNEKFELSLGVARRIKVERELVKKEVEGKGLLGKSRRITYGYKIKVENHKKSKCKFLIMDQLPVPEHEDIKVEAEVIDPKAKKIDDMKRITWKFYLEPGAKKTLKLEFNVEHSNKMVIYGLPE